MRVVKLLQNSRYENIYNLLIQKVKGFFCVWFSGTVSFLRGAPGVYRYKHQDGLVQFRLPMLSIVQK